MTQRDRDRIETGEVLDLGDLQRRWYDLEKLYARVRGFKPDPRALTARAFDEAQPAGRRTYIAADRYLGVAMENHHALKSLLAHFGATPYAPWSLLRPSFEAAFWVCWMLDPDDGLERRRRGLRVEMMDDKQQLAHIREFLIVPEVSATAQSMLDDRGASSASYRADAEALKLPWDVANRKITVTDELPKLSWLKYEPPIVRATMVAQWRMLSGYEHGLGWALLRGSHVVERAKIEGGYEVQLTIDDDAFTTAAQCVMWMTISALKRLDRLNTGTVN